MFLILLARILVKEAPKFSYMDEYSRAYFMSGVTIFLIGVALNNHYIYLCGGALIGYFSGFISHPFLVLLFVISFISFCVMFDIGRASIIAFLTLIILRTSYKKIILGITVVCLVALTLLKFGSEDYFIMFNVINRFSILNQLIVYFNIDSLEFTVKNSALLSLVQNLPFIRSQVNTLDEIYLFYQITSGGTGGLAVSPEMRSMIWSQKTIWLSLLDLGSMYFILYCFCKFAMKFFHGFILVLANFAFFIQFDNYNFISNAILCFLILTGLFIRKLKI